MVVPLAWILFILMGFKSLIHPSTTSGSTQARGLGCPGPEIYVLYTIPPFLSTPHRFQTWKKSAESFIIPQPGFDVFLVENTRMTHLRGLPSSYQTMVGPQTMQADMAFFFFFQQQKPEFFVFVLQQDKLLFFVCAKAAYFFVSDNLEESKGSGRPWSLSQMPLAPSPAVAASIH